MANDEQENERPNTPALSRTSSIIGGLAGIDSPLGDSPIGDEADLEGYSGWNTEEDYSGNPDAVGRRARGDSVLETGQSPTIMPSNMTFPASLTGSRSAFSNGRSAFTRPYSMVNKTMSKHSDSQGSRSIRSNGRSLDIDAVSVSLSDLDAGEDRSQDGYDDGTSDNYDNDEGTDDNSNES